MTFCKRELGRYCDAMNFVGNNTKNELIRGNVGSVKACIDTCRDEFAGGYWNGTSRTCHCKQSPVVGSETYYPDSCKGSGFMKDCRTCQSTGRGYCDLTSTISTTVDKLCDNPLCSILCSDKAAGNYPNPWDSTGRA